ncbi:hypothetical protein W97_05786 [Coniosporium apollinis CBS 100218]|uniref:prephenate dehydratase n=1 Tax=Coniosporium apollinis (strain CBS 100218) TaxID=1168221 RepID=R7YY11_CONA1|nr:uncharacterized protein W97_05786 [Coniosporium apollinis CBS 100218]EON66541.1 hypothetical protein W97_05786 [Coniosporium apollinis CBS 100218]
MEGAWTIAFLGPKASYTHQAALNAFSGSNFHLEPLIAIEDVFEAVQCSHANRGVVPFENSTNGSVVQTLDLFADLQKRNPDIIVCGEAYVGVRHCLLGHVKKPVPASTFSSAVIEANDDLSPISSGRATPTLTMPDPLQPKTQPLTNIKHVRKLYSHPQAWGQCKSFLSAYLKGSERQDVSSTSRAAELVASDESGTSAAISSEIAARVHSLDILAQGIEDRPDNTTRFLIIMRRSSPDSRHGEMHDTPGIQDCPDDQNDGMDTHKSLVSFTVDHEDAGALTRALAVFQKHGLNLTSFNSRPSGIAPWNYIFFVEFKGRRCGGGEGAVNAALRELDEVARGRRWLGSWESNLDRR